MKKFSILSMAALVFTFLSGTALASGSHDQEEPAGMKMNHGNMSNQNQMMGIQAMGKLNSVNMNKHKVNISHGPIQALSWPPMRMDFSVQKGVSLSKLMPGQKVSFSLMKSGEYEYVITNISVDQ